MHGDCLLRSMFATKPTKYRSKSADNIRSLVYEVFETQCMVENHTRIRYIFCLKYLAPVSTTYW